MNKTRVLILFFMSIVACITIFLIIVFNNASQKVNKNEVVISNVDLKTVDNLIIGSELPKILYADKEKVIIDCCGVYVYDKKNKVITQSLDILSFMAENYSNCLLNCFTLKDGKQVVFGFSKDTGVLVAGYSYSFENKLVKELTEMEYTDYLKDAFKCEFLNHDDELYQKSSGMIANISDNKYVYLTFHDWKVSTLNIVYVNNNKETYYNVFDK